MASNVITDVIPKLLAQGLVTLRENCVMPRLVNSYTSFIAGKKGQTVDVPIANAMTPTAVTPANVAPNAQAVVPDTIPVTLDQWYENPFDLDDKQMEEAMDGVIPMQAAEAVKGLCNLVDQQLLALYLGSYLTVGTAGQVPFATIDDATNIAAVLNQQLAPNDENRHVVLDPFAQAKAIGLTQFANSEFSGSVDAIREGRLNVKLGMNWWMNQQIPIHVRNALGTGALTVNGVNALGATSVSIAKAAGASWSAKLGDVITIAHGGTTGTRSYVITANTTVTQNTNSSVPIFPALPVATAGGEVVTSIDSHRVNLAFHRDAIAFATRPLQSLPAGMGNLVSLSQVDPISGLALRIEVVREHKRIRWSYDLLWGQKLVRPQHMVRVLGQST